MVELYSEIMKPLNPRSPSNCLVLVVQLYDSTTDVPLTFTVCVCNNKGSNDFVNTREFEPEKSSESHDNWLKLRPEVISA